MRTSFKKAVAVIAAVGAVSVGGASVASASTVGQIAVPDVVGYSAPVAVDVLENAGFTSVRVAGPYGDSAETTVTRTSVADDAVVAENTPITIFVDPW
ncbi:PASTA domain-containing protein [Rhodococcus sovatensis]|uniref:PASTA domain-containing protein n=1 Tax=Rhodococcus sovatensis TaxID=1805840 RepID=A0ABZ2PEV6_9NOCA